MAVSKSGFIYGVIIFYVIIATCMTFYGNFLLEEGLNVDDDLTYNEQSAIGDYNNSDKFQFIPSIIAGFNGVPWWLNAILFSPLIAVVLFVFITTILGVLFDGGN